MNWTDKELCEKLCAARDLPTCSQWAKGFVDSINEQHQNGRTLTVKQKEICLRILGENSPEEVQKHLNWELEYNSKYKDLGVLIATYYKNQNAGYYGDISAIVLRGDLPNRRKFFRMINNKFAKKIVNELERKPRFTSKDIVIPNSSFCSSYGFRNIMMEPVGGNKYPSSPPLKERENFKNNGGIIIGIDNIIKSAAKGSKRYKILPFGSMKLYYVEERFMKKKPKSKKAKK